MMKHIFIKIIMLSTLILGVGSVYADLKYPADCSHSKIKKAAIKGGCTVEPGGNHMIIKKGGKKVTILPHHVKSNNSCRSTIKAVNASCK